MLILLDIDGVMVPATSWRRPEFENDGFLRFSRKSIVSLQKIISETGADILLTTSHKSSYSIAQWKNIFSARGFENIKIKRLSENSNHLNRREEIMNWVVKERENSFVIIDDDKTLNKLPDNIKSKLVQTSATVGLNEELANSAIRILKSSERLAS